MSQIPNRIIKESITTSEDIAKLSSGAEILFYRLIVKVDDYGAYFGNEQIVKSECFPLKGDELKSAQVKKWLDELDAVGLIIRYTAADGRKYLRLTKWANHQRIRNQKSKFPPFDGSCRQLTANDSKLLTNASVIQSNPNTNPNPNSNPNPNPYPTEAVLGEVGKASEERRQDTEEYGPDFEIFWNTYPRKVGKKEAYRAFRKAGKPVQLLVSAVKAQMDSEQWTKENGRFIPNPATWLNQGRWDDQIISRKKNVFLELLEESNDEAGGCEDSVIVVDDL